MEDNYDDDDDDDDDNDGAMFFWLSEIEAEVVSSKIAQLDGGHDTSSSEEDN